MTTRPVLTDNLALNTEKIMGIIGHNYDVIVRNLQIGDGDCQASIIYISSLADSTAINNYVLQPLLLYKNVSANNHTLQETLMNNVIQLGFASHETYLDGCVEFILLGQTVLLVEGTIGGIMLNTMKGHGRSIEEPVTETVVRGSREGFVESLSINVSLLRKSLKDPAFSMLKYQIGRRTKRDLIVAYMSGITNEELVEEVVNRLEKIDIDDVPESGYIEQLIEDNHFSPFPQMINTERPDRVVNALLEGRVAILLDGTPFALLVPVTINMLLQSPEDYYDRWIIGSLLRLLRYITVLLALFLPAVYISLTAYHQGLIPTRLAISISETRESVPFPNVIEAIFMEITIEILREAGLRLPKPIGQAVGIVGGLVIGQSAVEAGIVSPIMVVVVALTAISSFAIPHYGAAIAVRVLRFGMMFAAAVLGFYGILLGFLLICSHISKLKSFGVNYGGVFVRYRSSDWKDTMFRAPLQMMKKRPKFLRTIDRNRMKP